MRFTSIKLIGVACLLAIHCNFCGGADNRTADLSKANTTYEEARNKARAELTRGFDQAIDKVGRQKLAAEERLKMIDILKAEKERFEKKELIPWSEPMRPYLASYQRTLAAAEADLKRAYQRAIDRALKNKADDEIERLRTDLTAALDAKVLALWKHLPGNQVRTIRLWSNGRLGEDGKSNWTYERGTLTLRFADPKAPGGFWIDVCQVSQDGTTYSGENQHKVQIGGRYIESGTN